MTGQACPRCGRAVAGGKFCPGCGSPIGDPLTGRVLGGRLTVAQPVRRSAFFTTYRVEAKSGGAPGVVKVLAPFLAGDDAKRRRFLENAGAAMSYTGPGLLPVREMADETVPGADGKPVRVVYAVADASTGRSLQALVTKEGPLAPARAAACLKGILEALGPVHAAGGVHGDLHPACVLLEQGGGGERVRLADAGLAAGLAPARSEEPAALGSDGGRWISPEQAAGQGASAASDVHAAGAILHFALTGQCPWQAAKGPSLLYEIQKSVPRPASETRPGMPASLDSVLDRAMAKSPRDRFPGAAAFLRALDEARASLPPAPALLVEEEPETPPAVQALPADMTLEAPAEAGAPPADPDEATMTGVASASDGDATMAAPRAAPEEEADETMAAPRPPAAAPGDETLVAPRSVTPPRKAAGPPPAPPGAPPARPPASGGAPGKAAKPRPAAAPAKPSPERTVAARVLAASAAPAAAPAPAVKKVRGPWSVGSPVGIFAILLGLGVGALYGAVWAGYLDAQIPPWLRSLTGRNEVPAVRETTSLLPRASYELTLNVVLPAPLALPLEGTGAGAIYGRWRLVKDPREGDAAGGEAEPEKVFAMGDLRGLAPSGVIPVALSVPPGRYRLQGTLRYGEVAPKVVEVREAPKTESLDVVPGSTVLVVKVVQQLGHVTLTRDLAVLAEKEVPKGEDLGQVFFGIPSDGAGKRLRFGEEVTVSVKAEGFKPAQERVRLLENPQVLSFLLVEDPGDKVTRVLLEVAKSQNMPPRYQDDPVVLADPRVKVALARAAAGKGAWDRVDFYVDDLRGALGEGALPAGTEELFTAWHEHLRTRAGEAADRGDTARVQAYRAKARPEILAGSRAEEERSRWAELEIRAWLRFEKAAFAPPAPEDLAFLAAVVDRDLKAAFPENRERLQKEVAETILLPRAWFAWDRGTEMRPTKAGDPPAVPGPGVAAWLDLARKAWPPVVDTLPCQRLQARLEDLGAAPEKVVRRLTGDPLWGPGKVVPAGRRDALTKKDRLLLARALSRWGDLRQGDAASEEAMKLWDVSWEVYQTVFDPDPPAGDFPEEMAAAARLEGAFIALRVRGNETAYGAFSKYLALRAGDREAVRLKEVLTAAKPMEVPAKMKELRIDLVFIPAGRFRAGTDQGRSPTDERPFGDGKEIPIRVLPAREHDMAEFGISLREVSRKAHDAYLRAMADPAQASLYRHPEEPPEKMKPGARDLKANLQIGPDEPVRGVDWWDAWACCRFLGGRLPTEVEWEKAARWNGRILPAEDPIPGWRSAGGLREQWRAFWQPIPSDLSPFDFAPCGARGFYGGVAEWTMDPLGDGAPGVKEGVALSVAVIPPVLRAGDMELMAVRGGSFHHQPPGESPGPSPVVEPAPAAGEAPKKGGEAGAPRPTVFRAMDLLERRGVPAGRQVKWIGFRVVLGSPASQKPR